MIAKATSSAEIEIKIPGRTSLLVLPGIFISISIGRQPVCGLSLSQAALLQVKINSPSVDCVKNNLVTVSNIRSCIIPSSMLKLFLDSTIFVIITIDIMKQ